MGIITSLVKLAVAYPETLLSLVSFVVLFFYSGIRRSRVPRNWPLLGMFPSVLTQIHRFYEWCVDLIPIVGSTFLFKGPWFSGMDILITIDPANINHIFNANFVNYPKGAQFLEIFDILGDGIFNADSDSWKSQRKAVHSLMSEPRFRRFVDVFDVCTKIY
ncbi:unnamed protein product [Spirodela intermedia]|uniref:Uncharacterized protein n=1 Tax=Spirodela intermedia TaxID=51605 RepID=A0A7I8J7M1_SPIIN|nr:unnamed protein product [Spirodela intermedia]CAA6666236.1 unnamed protein product [Spirodela intermedia]